MDFVLSGEPASEALVFLVLILPPFLTGLALSLRLRGAFFTGERLLLALIFGVLLFTGISCVTALVFGLSRSLAIAVESLMLIAGIAGLAAYWRNRHFGNTTLSSAKRSRRGGKVDRAGAAVFVGSLVIFAVLASRLMLWQNGGLATGYLDAWGDLPLHLSLITSFLNEGPLRLRSTIMANQPLAYPFLADFFSAALMCLGLSLEQAVELPAVLFNAVTLTMLSYLSYRLVRHRRAAMLTPALLVLAGGLGFWWFLFDLYYAPKPIWEFLQHLPRRYTNLSEVNIHWVNPVLAHLLPQRSFLFGFPLGLTVILLWWQQRSQRLPKAAVVPGLVAGALPLFHTHTFLTLMLLAAIFGGLALLRDGKRQFLRYWLVFALTALLVATPALWFLLSSPLSLHAIRWHPGWMAEGENWVWFWLKNTSVFIPLLLSALLAARRLRLRPHTLRFYLPFGLLFVICNLLLFSVFAYDTNKVLIFWFLLSLPLVARLLMALWQAHSWWLHGFAFRTLLLALTFSGALNLIHEFQNNGWQELSAEEVQLAQRLRRLTEANAIFLTAPIHNNLLTLAGRGVVLGYPGHVISHGLPAAEVEQAVTAMFRADSSALPLLRAYGVDYIVCGPTERQRFSDGCQRIDRLFPLLTQSENYRIYRATPQPALMSTGFDRQAQAAVVK